MGHIAWLANTTGTFNTAIEGFALDANSTGSHNAALGLSALGANTIGSDNVAVGNEALFANTTGTENVALGRYALDSNTTANNNTAVGSSALSLGFNAGTNLTTGDHNIDIGAGGVAGESGTIRLGNAANHDRAFIAGIRGVTTGNANAIAVLIDSAGQLGTVSSSARYKEDVADLGEASERLLALRPVQFRYKAEVQAGERPIEYGLIAEEVAEVFPELVVYDAEGRPETVRYQVLVPLLLNELQRLERQVAELQQRR